MRFFLVLLFSLSASVTWADVRYDASKGNFPQDQGFAYSGDINPDTGTNPSPTVSGGILYEDTAAGNQYWYANDPSVNLSGHLVLQAVLNIISSNYIANIGTGTREGYYLEVVDSKGNVFSVGLADAGYSINTIGTPNAALTPYPISVVGSFHTYRLEVNNFVATFFIDGTQVAGGIGPNNFGNPGGPTVYFGAAAGRARSVTELKSFCYGTSAVSCGCPRGVTSASPCISSPMDGAKPQSQFVAVSGTGTPNDTLDVLVAGASVGQVQVDSEGNWEALPYVSLYGSSVTVQVQDQTSANSSNTITIHPSPAAFLPGPSSPVNSLTALLPLRKADILVTASNTSPQYVLYGPNYTHAALYLGGDSNGNGTPLIAEAITATEAGSSIGTAGQVRSIPLDQSLAWTQSKRISAWRPKPAFALPEATRNAIITWAQTKTSQGLPYWTNGDFGLIAAAAKLYGSAPTSLLVPAYLNKIYTLTTSTSTFICSTLVWRAYYEGTVHTLDISQPNLMDAQPGSLLETFSPGFMHLLAQPPAGCTGCDGSVLIVPETFVRSPFLSQIF